MPLNVNQPSILRSQAVSCNDTEAFGDPEPGAGREARHEGIDVYRETIDLPVGGL